MPFKAELGRSPWRRRLLALGLAGWALASAAAVAQSPGAGLQLLQGARHFREDQFAEALVAFKAAERLGADPEVRWYIAATLGKLGRSEDAVEAFRQAERDAMGGDDALLAYYSAMACYEARLYACAEQKLQSLGARVGPRIGAQARKVLDDISRVFQRIPGESVDTLLIRGTTYLDERRPLLAQAYFDEAASLARKRGDPERLRRANERSAEARARQSKGAAP